MSIDFEARGRIGDLALDAAFRSDGRLTALFGRSGAGKTTIVNIIAGLRRLPHERVVVDGAVLSDTAQGIRLPPHKRRIGYVFQDARLFPHLSVRQNLLYGRYFARGETRTGLEEVCALLGLEPLLQRGVTALSGGEKQRVAIGRALLAHPRLLLLDEPLASLDEARKQEVMPYLERLRDEAGVPIVYVSHSVAEVARLATTLVLVEDGRVTGQGGAQDMLSRLDLGLAEERDTAAVLDGVVAKHDEAVGLTTLRTQAGELRVPLLAQNEGTPVRALIRARDVMIATRRPEGLSALNVLPGVVKEIGTAHGAIVEITIACGEATLVARLTRYSVDALKLAPGRKVYGIVKSIAFDPAATGAFPGSESR
ncbi:Sulfate/thiosulfate import ATP-binding protein CysA [Methyloligella halotolerans]|uniref:Sulfate/thiosulfate import ATP-binding protein CysA n=1 Tax=Methyloligella halotolerans TaxID=1177755 RepID=A0A1E2RWK4_9HYPH|nr:molybdenum ABC transporter ATP-binding protein [Methyloligella halotolerans]ODA66646.1 Sulfate/thiosulfate import ATP-binding protein CysA [Methyloligella halotolerans]